MNINEIASNFDLDGTLIYAREFGSGHINNTYIADCGEKKYVIQKINTGVFKDADALMDNVFSVTEYLKKEIEKSGGDSQRGTLNFIRTKDGKKYFKTKDGECYRAYAFVDGSVSFDFAATAEIFGASGKAFGRFQKMLSGFPAENLREIIPHFHDTLWRYENEFLSSLMNTDGDLISLCEGEIEFIKSRKDRMNGITAMIKDGKIPLRVTHNDTKLNNVLFDKKTNEPLAVIDLDTIMPGSALYDFGDSIRFGASTAAEDETELDKVKINLEYFRVYAEEFLKEAGSILTNAEKEYLAFSAWLMTLENGMRFLTDFLNGNIYFKTDYPEHNFDRAKNQLKLVTDMENKAEEMNGIIKNLI